MSWEHISVGAISLIDSGGLHRRINDRNKRGIKKLISQNKLKS